MESNLRLILASDNRLMAFRGEIKAERWGIILKDLDDFSRRAVQEILGDEQLNNEFKYRVNCDIPATFAAILLTIEEVPNGNWWVEYLKMEGFKAPEDMPEILMERIQILSPVILKAARIKRKFKDEGRAPGNTRSPRAGDAGPSSSRLQDMNCDFVDYSLLDE
ncbi:hypothetical protein SUGI_0627540 [Cryptomeria japonica]|nr:hypothetical protein SUGI_0627540 [Cryptomeria japonica]